MGAYAYHFFMKHAGYSYDPKVETKERGRIKCAQALARAERMAWEMGDSFQWIPDEDNPKLLVCIMYAGSPALGADDSTTGRVLASLGGIDFGDGEPWGDPYKRVVEAELALEVYPQ